MDTTARPEPNRNELREMILADVVPLEAILHYATQCMLDTSDLWWLYDTHRIMATADAWLLAMNWENLLDPLESSVLENPSFWTWFDNGRHRY